MAKVKIQGNASGTGVLTVTAPNTSTDRTITLPDSTDTLAVNSDVTNKLPLAGGTMSGNLIVNASVNAAGSGTGGGFHFADGNAMIYRDTNDMVFKLQGAEKIRLLSSGGISFNGDTAAANALDDYEEGTWTPAISATSSNPTVTYNNQYGWYLKIGSLVHIGMWIEIASISGGYGDVFVTLPFTSSNHNYGVGGWAANRMSNDQSLSGSRTDLSFSISSSTTQMRLSQSGGSNSNTQFTSGVNTTQISGNSEFAGIMTMTLI